MWFVVDCATARYQATIPESLPSLISHLIAKPAARTAIPYQGGPATRGRGN